MTDDREPFREARAAGLQKRHEKRLENATYTAADMKVLTEAALRRGRKEALEEVLGWATEERDMLAELCDPGGREDVVSHIRTRAGAFRDMAFRINRSITSPAPPDATSGRTDREAK